MKETYYTSGDLARDLKCSVFTARRILRELYPKHEPRSWWRFDGEEKMELLRKLAAPEARLHFGIRCLHHSHALLEAMGQMTFEFH